MEREPTIEQFLIGKSAHSLTIFDHFTDYFAAIDANKIEPTKTMIGISNDQKRITWVTQFGKNFIHIVFPFEQPYSDNLCFQKIAQVPVCNQFNHHFRILKKEDVNEEILHFMREVILIKN